MMYQELPRKTKEIIKLEVSFFFQCYLHHVEIYVWNLHQSWGKNQKPKWTDDLNELKSYLIAHSTAAAHFRDLFPHL